MRWLQLFNLETVLCDNLGFTRSSNNDPGVLACRSPGTGLLVPLPMGQGDYLPEPLVRHILRDENMDFEALVSLVNDLGGVKDE